MTGKIQWKILSRKVRKQKKMFYFEKLGSSFSFTTKGLLVKILKVIFWLRFELRSFINDVTMLEEDGETMLTLIL